jgi:hypothetical protein
MKLNEKNIDSWLKSNLEGASSPVEEALLETILIQNKTNNRKRLLVFWVNILMIAAWLVFYVNYRTNSVISENKEVVNERVQSDERETKGSGKNEELAKTLNSNGSSNTLDQSIKTGINERPLALIKHDNYIKPTLPKDLMILKNDLVLSFESTTLIAKPIPDLFLFPEWLKPTITQTALTQFEAPKTKNANDSSNSFLKKLIKEVMQPKVSYGFSLGYTQNQAQIDKKTPNQDKTNKYYQDAVSKGFGSSNGFQFGTALKFGYSRFSANTGINFSHSVQSLNIDVPAWEVPVIDIDGTIRGYLILSDTTNETILVKSKFTQNEIMLPINLSYNQRFLRTFSLELGVGLMPKLQTIPKLKLPGTADMLDKSDAKVKAKVSMPMIVRAGVYKDFKQFSAGFTGIVTPFYNSKTRLPGEMDLNNKQLSFQLTLFKKL